MNLFYWLYDHTVVAVHYRLMAAIRMALFALLRSQMSFEAYDNPITIGGYNGVYVLGEKAIVFERIDGSFQYLW